MEIYDDKSFFDNYHSLRQNPDNYNDNFEHPYIMELVGEVKGLDVLDVGCGYGVTCADLMARGAKAVHGIDVSARMIEHAKKTNGRNGITYEVRGAEDIGEINKSFDVAVSSLALHYVKDLGKVFSAIHGALRTGGRLVFSVEHPIYTATLGNTELWITDGKGKKIGFAIDNYANEGVRHIVWLDKEITKYHRTVSSFVRLLCESGFMIEGLYEPCPPPAMRERIAEMEKEVHRPPYLFISAKKL